MTEKDFFKHYIPALEASLAYDPEMFDVKGPDWFIEDDLINKELDAFENEHFEKHQVLFEMVALYLDARSHNFGQVNDLSLEEYKKRLEAEISSYKKKFELR